MSHKKSSLPGIKQFLGLYMSQGLRVWLIRLVVISTRQLCTKMKIDQFHLKPWFPKMHHIFGYYCSRIFESFTNNVILKISKNNFFNLKTIFF